MRLRTILLAMMLVCTLMMQAADKAWFLVTDKGEEFEGYSNFNLELLRILQKYQDK